MSHSPSGRRPTPAQLARARKLLAHEGTAVACAGATAAGRVYDKLHAHLAPLVGPLGVQMLFVRSGKLTQGEFAWLGEVSPFDGSTKLRERLRAHDPAVGTEAAAALFATFFALITTLIGERLTTQLLSNAWPTVIEQTTSDETASTEENNE